MFMLIDPEQTLAPVSFLDRVSAFVASALSRVKTHNYTNQVEQTDYVFEWIENGDRAQMTAYGRGIKQRDYLILKHGRYQIEAIDYYANPSHLWTAMLVKVSK